jgi:ureidoacrylate peracid hydrolase
MTHKDELKSFPTKKPDGFTRTKKQVTINTSPSPLEIDLHKTALIVVDMQNGFVSKGGMFDHVGMDISGAQKVIRNTRKIIAAARESGCKIVFLKMSYDADYANSGGPESPNWHREIGLVTMRNQPQHWGRFVTQGSWDEEICDQLVVQPGDMVVRKHRYSGFAGTNLDSCLKSYNIKYCIYAGVATNVCVESTLRDGYFLDYWPVLVADAADNAGPEFTQQATIWNVENLFGWVISTQNLLAGFL